MRIAIFGAGYVGCVSAVCLARFGHKVWLVESADNKMELMRAGKSPVVEPGLEQDLGEYLNSGQITPVASATQAVLSSDLAMICVGTPSQRDGQPDLKQIRQVLLDISTALDQRPGQYVVALRSTVPFPLLESELLPEFMDNCRGRFGTEITLALNPEFLREGSAIKDFLDPPFVMVGTESEFAVAMLKEIYQPIRAPFLVVSPGSASLLKYACNAFHAAKIVFANEIASLAPFFKADADRVMEIFCQDKLLNISRAYLRPGFAYGGPCLTKDVRALNQLARRDGIPCSLLEALPESNSLLIERTVQLIQRLSVRRITFIGLSFKVGTDDMRESPLVELAERLIGKGYELKVFDPDVKLEKLQGRNLQYAHQHIHHLTNLLLSDIKNALEQTELVIIGKPIFSNGELEVTVPKDVRVLDLTRRISRHETSLHLLQLAELDK